MYASEQQTFSRNHIGMYSMQRKENMTDEFFNQWLRYTQKKKIRVTITGVEAMTVRLLVRMLQH